MASAVQAVVFDKNFFDEKMSDKWLKAHGYSKIKPFHITPNTLRARIREPDKFKRFVTKHLKREGVLLIIGFY